MNFKRNFPTISLILTAVFCLTSCADKTAFKAYEFKPLVTDEHVEESLYDGALVKKGEYNDLMVVNSTLGNDRTNIGSFYDVMTKNSGKKIFKSKDEQKIIVIPVEFPDQPIENLYGKGYTSKYVNTLKNAFFGSSDKNQYVSVSQFYDISSYGQLKITGKVCDKVFEFPLAVETINSSTKLYNDSTIKNTYDEIIDWYNANYDDIDEYKIDSESDVKYNVPIYLVYDYIALENSDFFWHFTLTDTCLAWSSYSGLNLIKDKPDSHVLIHEVGHLLGLADYYPLSKGSSINTTTELFYPVGCIDMMDSSIGDHTALSKMELDWVRPYQVKDSCEVTLKSFSESGDLLLLNDELNGSVFDEYYLLEFYTPTGLNTYDLVHGNLNGRMPSIPGIKLYHVDATLGYYSPRGALLGGVDEPGNSSSNKINFIHDNSEHKVEVNSGSEDSTKKIYENYLYELIYNHYNASTGEVAKDEHLYHIDDTIMSFPLKGQRFANYRITITGMNYREATLKIEKRKN